MENKVITTKKSFEGWAVKYSLPSQPMSLPNGRKVTEIILPNAFSESIAAINSGKQLPIKLNIEHDKNSLSTLGTTAKNVRLENRTEGVYVYVDLLGDTISADLFARIEAGLVQGFSVEFQTGENEPTYTLDASRNYIRKISKATLVGIAITTQPAYTDAKIVQAGAVSARSISKTELATIEAEILKMEMRTKMREHELWMMQNFRGKHKK